MRSDWCVRTEPLPVPDSTAPHPSSESNEWPARRRVKAGGRAAGAPVRWPGRPLCPSPVRNLHPSDQVRRQSRAGTDRSACVTKREADRCSRWFPSFPRSGNHAEGPASPPGGGVFRSRGDHSPPRRRRDFGNQLIDGAVTSASRDGIRINSDDTRPSRGFVTVWLRSGARVTIEDPLTDAVNGTVLGTTRQTPGHRPVPS